MTKNLRTFKASIVMGILLVSIFTIFMPSGSAALIKSQAHLQIEPVNPADLSQRVRPLEPISIELRIRYSISGIFANRTITRFRNRNMPVQINLFVEKTPDFVSASFDRNSVAPIVGPGWISQDANLLVSFQENIPARGPVVIRVKMEAERVIGIIYEIEQKTQYAEIQVVPEYIPIIDATPRKTYTEVSPGEAAEFEIDLENLGNAKTEFVFKIIDVPAGWIASIPANTFVGSAATGESPKKVITLLITPPYGFGYHNELQNIKISIQGQYFAGSGPDDWLQSDEYEHVFTVRSRGFSTPGFEAVFVLVALIGIAFVIKKRRKTK
ncbi:MAG: hypothetical protein KAH91_01895 [Thermoplasmatales archaeon]|nr:hypothetical protein [Thermoplasmatales archaeon]